jgi:hypothetical protein
LAGQRRQLPVHRRATASRGGDSLSEYAIRNDLRDLECQLLY